MTSIRNPPPPGVLTSPAFQKALEKRDSEAVQQLLESAPLSPDEGQWLKRHAQGLLKASREMDGDLGQVQGKFARLMIKVGKAAEGNLKDRGLEAFSFLEPQGTPAGATHTERMRSVCPITKKQIQRYVTEPYEESTTGIPVLKRLRKGRDLSSVHTTQVIGELGPKRGGEVLSRIRNVNTALFTGPTMDLAQMAADIDPAQWSQLPRWGQRPDLRLLKRQGDQPMIEVRPKPTDSRPKDFSNATFVTAHGQALAEAMMDVNRVLFAKIEDELAPKLEGEGFDTMMRSFTFQRDPKQVLWEGVVTVTQALDLLLAHPSEPPKPLEELLDDIAESGLIATMAMAPPFGQIGPMQGRGLDPSGITFSDRGRAQMPEAMLARFEEAHGRRNGVPADFSETLRGCPVGARGVTVNDKGELELTNDSPLKTLGKEYIRLLKIALDEGAPKATPPKPPTLPEMPS